LDFWFGRINYEQRIPKPGDLKLDRMRALLDRLGNPEKRLRIVHVAGTKGKGSTAAMLAAILQRASYRTGLFTSPHLCRVEERIQVDGRAVTPDELACLATDVQRAIRRQESEGRAQGSLNPTFFEVATALGFLQFVRRRVGVAVIEVGLGGRFDSTNVCLPEVSLITSISLDHVQQLGDRLAGIAMEKAGIVKPGRPAVNGATGTEARDVIERICRVRHAALRELGVDFRYNYIPGKVAPSNGNRRPQLVRRPVVQVVTRRRTWPAMKLGLLGEHQAANAAVAVACVEVLQDRGWHIGDQAVKDGLEGVSWPARLELVGSRPVTVLDCAHNVASAQALVDTLTTSFAPRRRLLVFASSDDKDVPGLFRVLAPHFSHVFLTRYSSNPRSLRPGDLAELLRRSADLPCTVCPTAAEALAAARRRAAFEDLICITGSVFLAGELRPLLVPAGS
jgi:dihydrofolate synthase/folylpolyglutamate synthase